MNVLHDALFKNCINCSTPPNRKVVRVPDKIFLNDIFWTTDPNSKQFHRIVSHDASFQYCTNVFQFTEQRGCHSSRQEMSLIPSRSYKKCTQYAGGKYGYFDVIMVLHIISYKIIITVGIYTKFFHACFKTFGTMSETMWQCFLSDSMAKQFLFTAENTWITTFVYNIIVLEWLGNNGSKMWEWHQFLPLPLLIPINIKPIRLPK